jgi:hypothetical protein
MQNSFPGWVIDRMFTEIRYASTPAFFDKKQEVFTRLLTQLPHYNIQNIDLLTMHSKEMPGKELVLSPNRFAYTYEMIKVNDNFVEDCKEKWTLINNKLNVNSVERFGMRAFFLKEMDIKDATSHLKKYIDTTKIKNIANLSTVDYAFVFKEMEKTIRVATNAGEMQSIILSTEYAQSESRNIKGYIVDIDFSIENIPSKFIPNLIEEGIDKFKKYIQNFE